MPPDDEEREKHKKTRRTPVGGIPVIKRTTPTGGIPAVTDESWEAARTTSARAPTARGEETVVQGIDRRMRETKNAALENLDRVEQLRKETREDILRVSTKVEGTDTKLDAVIEVVSELRGEVGEQAGQNTVIIDLLKEAREARQQSGQLRTTTQLAQVKVNEAGELTRLELLRAGQLTDLELLKAAKLADIDALAKARADKRELIKAYATKALAAIGVVWAFISVTYLSHCGGG